jgi:nitrogen fixation protein NifB
VGLLGEEFDEKAVSLLRESAALPLIPGDKRPYIACASREGALINMHLGRAEKIYIYSRKKNGYALIGVRKAPESGNGAMRWLEFAEVLKDCSMVLVEAAGRAPREALAKLGIKVVTASGLVEEALEEIFTGNLLYAPVSGSGPCGCGEKGDTADTSMNCGCSGPACG